MTKDFPLHPGGSGTTLRLLRLAMPHSVHVQNRRALDMGAGNGAAVRLLERFGWDAEGIDKKGCAGILSGDMLCLPYPDKSFGLVFSECSFFITGDFDGALREAWRVLTEDGLLAMGDVYFGDLTAWKNTLKSHSFHLLEGEDITKLWREYYIESIWNGTVDHFCHSPTKNCHYYLTVATKKSGDFSLSFFHDLY